MALFEVVVHSTEICILNELDQIFRYDLIRDIFICWNIIISLYSKVILSLKCKREITALFAICCDESNDKFAHHQIWHSVCFVVCSQWYYKLQKVSWFCDSNSIKQRPGFAAWLIAAITKLSSGFISAAQNSRIVRVSSFKHLRSLCLNEILHHNLCKISFLGTIYGKVSLLGDIL